MNKDKMYLGIYYGWICEWDALMRYSMGKWYLHLLYSGFQKNVNQCTKDIIFKYNMYKCILSKLAPESE